MTRNNGCINTILIKINNHSPSNLCCTRVILTGIIRAFLPFYMMWYNFTYHFIHTFQTRQTGTDIAIIDIMTLADNFS